MTSPNPRAYLETQVRTASREKLLLMLYDGAIRFCDRARGALVERDIEQSHEFLLRVQHIVMELLCSLNPETDEQVVDRLRSLYVYMYRRLVEANIQKSVEPLDEVVGLLNELRTSWAEAIDSLKTEGRGAGGPPDDHRLSVQG